MLDTSYSSEQDDRSLEAWKITTAHSRGLFPPEQISLGLGRCWLARPHLARPRPAHLRRETPIQVRVEPTSPDRWENIALGALTAPKSSFQFREKK